MQGGSGDCLVQHLDGKRGKWRGGKGVTAELGWGLRQEGKVDLGEIFFIPWVSFGI